MALRVCTVERFPMLKKVLFLALIAGSIATQATAQQQRPAPSGREAEEKACGRDVSRFCKAVINGDDLTVLSCLQANRPKISPACQKVLKDNGV
jgi:hypothetical protein